MPTARQLKNVVFVINSLVGGGAERAVVNILKGSEQYSKKYKITLVVLDTNTEVHQPPDYVDVIRLDGRESILGSILQLRPILHSLQPDVVVSALSRANVSTLLLKRFGNFRVIACEHNYTSIKHKGLSGSLAKTLIRLTYPSADKIIGVSDGICRDLTAHFGVRPDQVVAIQNPIDVDAILLKSKEPSSLNLSEPYILGMGRFAPQKNFAMLIEAYAASQFRGPLVLLGQGPEREALMSLARRLGVEDRVLMPGFMSNPFPVLRDALAYVLSSNFEGLPTALIEALVLGTPVISTNCMSGPSEILDEQGQMSVEGVTQAKYGVLVPPDNAAAMTEALNGLLPPQLQNLRQRASQGAKRYSYEGPIEAYWSEIARLLA